MQVFTYTVLRLHFEGTLKCEYHPSISGFPVLSKSLQTLLFRFFKVECYIQGHFIHVSVKATIIVIRVVILFPEIVMNCFLIFKKIAEFITVP